MECLLNEQLDNQKRKIEELESYILCNLKTKQCQSLGTQTNMVIKHCQSTNTDVNMTKTVGINTSHHSSRTSAMTCADSAMINGEHINRKGDDTVKNGTKYQETNYSLGEGRDDEERTVKFDVLRDKSDISCEVVLGEQYEKEEGMNASVISLKGYNKLNERVKLLIMGDELAQNCAVATNYTINDEKYDIKGIVKPNLDIAESFKNVFMDTKSLGSNDYLIAMMKTDNISNHRSLNFILDTLIPIAKYTNLIIIIKCCSSKDQYICNKFKMKCSNFTKRNINACLYLNVVRNLNKQTASKLIKECVTICKQRPVKLLKTIITTTTDTNDTIYNSAQKMDTSSHSFLNPIGSTTGTP